MLHTGQQKVEGTYRLRDCLVSGAIAHNRLSKYAATAVKPTSPLFKVCDDCHVWIVVCNGLPPC